MYICTFTLLYKLSKSNTNTLQISDLPLSFDNYQYRVLLERSGNSCGSVSNSITLTVNPLPIVNSSVRLVACDNDTDGFSSFNLNELSRLEIENQGGGYGAIYIDPQNYHWTWRTFSDSENSFPPRLAYIKEAGSIYRKIMDQRELAQKA